jgi:hypothetical protein
MSEELDFSANIIREILEFMQNDIAEITEDVKEEKLTRVLDIISKLKILPMEGDTILWPERLERFGKLDEAQKAFVILAAADDQLDFSKLVRQGKKIDTIIKLSYLKEVRWFSMVAKKVEEIAEGKENIKKYLEQNPRLKRIGCGNFAKNFPDHVLRLLGHLLYPKIL